MKKSLVIAFVVFALIVTTSLAKAQGPDYRNQALSPDGRSIAYMHESQTGFQVVVANADGSDARQFNQDFFTYQATLLWSPDQHYIAITDMNRGAWNFWLLDLQSGQESFAAVGYAEAFTPNTDAILFSRDDSNLDSHVFSISFGDKGTFEFTQGSGLSFSPDGKHIAFETIDEMLAVMDADGTNIHKFVPCNCEPKWAPDGKSIAFVNVMDPKTKTLGEADVPNQQWELTTINADGSNVKVLADSPDSVYFNWSPDSSKIVFSSAGQLYLLGVNGNSFSGAGNGTDPVFSADGASIYFGDNPKGYFDIFEMKLDGSSTTHSITDGNIVLVTPDPVQ